jgi:hypothetical protein
MLAWSPVCKLQLTHGYSVFPSRMTAFGFKQAGGAKGMAEGHPWGTCTHLYTGAFLTSTAGRVGEPADMAGVGKQLGRISLLGMAH